MNCLNHIKVAVYEISNNMSTEYGVDVINNANIFKDWLLLITGHLYETPNTIQSISQWYIRLSCKSNKTTFDEIDIIFYDKHNFEIYRTIV